MGKMGFFDLAQSGLTPFPFSITVNISSVTNNGG